MLMVEHHMEVVTGLADRIAVMHHGALLACDTPAAIMRERDRPGGVPGGARCDARSLEVFAETCTSGSAGRTSCRASASTCPRAASPRCSAATASARRRRCGRCSGSSRRRGTVALGGAEHRRRSRRTRSCGAGVGYVPEDRDVFAGLTVAENLRLAERDGRAALRPRLRALPRAASSAPSSAPARSRAASSRWSRSPGRC